MRDRFPLLILVQLLLILSACSHAPKRSIAPHSTITAAPVQQQSMRISSEQQAIYRQALKQAAARNYVKADQLLGQLQTGTGASAALPWQVYANHGVVLYRMEQLARAEGQFRQAIRLHPDADLLNYLGLVLRRQGKFSDAEKAYLSALGLNRRFAPAYRNLAILYELYLFDYARATQYYQAYQQLRPAEAKQVQVWLQNMTQRAQVMNQ